MSKIREGSRKRNTGIPCPPDSPHKKKKEEKKKKKEDFCLRNLEHAIHLSFSPSVQYVSDLQSLAADRGRSFSRTGNSEMKNGNWEVHFSV